MKRHLQCAEQQMSRANLAKYCACHAERLTYLVLITYETSFTVRGATGVTIQPHQILRLSRRKTHILSPHHIWNVIYSARSNRCHDPTSPNTAPATQKDSHASSSSHMKRHLQCAEQQVSRSNLTEYCACHAKLHFEISAIIFENRWNVISNAGTIREWSEHDPRMIREWKRKPQPASQVRLLFEIPRSIFYCKIQRFAPNLTFKPSPSAAPATKSDTWTSPNTAPTTKNNTWTSPSTAPATKSNTWTSPNTAPTTKSNTWTSPSTAPATKSDTWTSPSTAPATKNNTWTSPSTAPTTKNNTWTSPSTAPATKSNTWTSPNTAPTTKSNTWTSPSTAPATKSDTWTLASTAPATKSDTWTSPNTAPTTLLDSTLLDLTLDSTLLDLTLDSTLYLTLLYLALLSTWHYSTWLYSLLDTTLLGSTLYLTLLSTWHYSTWHYSTWHYSTWLDSTLLDSTLLDLTLLYLTLLDSTLLDLTLLYLTLLDSTLLDLTLLYLTLLDSPLLDLTLLYLTLLDSTLLDLTLLYLTLLDSTLLDLTLLYLTLLDSPLLDLTLLYLTLLGCRSYIGSFSAKLPLIICNCLWTYNNANIFDWSNNLREKHLPTLDLNVAIIWQLTEGSTRWMGTSCPRNDLENKKWWWRWHLRKPATRACPAVWRLKCLNDSMPLPK